MAYQGETADYVAGLQSTPFTYEPPFLPDDDDEDSDSPPTFFEQPPASQFQVAGLEEVQVSDYPVSDIPNGGLPEQALFGGQQRGYNGFGAYEPPKIDFEDDEDEDSDVGEAPASIRFEMSPLNTDGRGAPSAHGGGIPGRRFERRHNLGVNYSRRRAKNALWGAMEGLSASIAELGPGSSKERSVKMWVETQNLDKLLKKIYAFYIGKGLYSILLARITNLFILAFIVAFSTFLFGCIDYSLIRKKQLLSEVIRPYCLRSIHGAPAFFLIVFSIWWTWQFLRLLTDIPQLLRIHRFYYHVLGITDAEMQTIDWRDIVNKIMHIPDIPGPMQTRAMTMKLDAHNIANRILRKDNYMIALFNKDILDLTVPFLGRRQMLTKIMEWNLSFCILSFAFNEEGRIRKRFIKDTNRSKLVNELKQRFAMMGLVNLICAPFIFFFFIMHFFFRYAQEFHKNPSSLGSRQYSPFARWKFREFNELPHLFERRLNRSYRMATKYMNQFPNQKITILARFIAFITGAFLTVLIIMTMVEEELLHGFEITPNRSVFFYIGIFGTVMAVSRGMVPDENEVFEPARMLRQVRQQFGILFEYKIVLFLQEILSVLFAPLILWYSLPSCAEQIVDFFREFTVHVDSLGYVCSFAVFDFKRHGNLKYGVPTQNQDEYYISKEGKMEQSFVNFKINNPDWEPRGDGSQYLNTILARGNELLQSQYMPDPGNSSSLLLHSLLRPRRNVKFNDMGGDDRHPALQGSLERTSQHLHPLHNVQPHPLFYGTSSTTGIGQRQLHQQSQLAESMLQGSEVGDGRDVGRTLFALLDAIYESNKTLY
ncbi:hypothetical protein SpCBS45565_g03676 [Spizellomyces sp. 'palustris']|nr:hypothetical protein SpCBS45565_g03676 [Spizellomyces sp. 'palustris']